MTNAPIISVNQLCKCYDIYDQPRDRLLQGLQRLWLGRKQYARKFWALHNVSIEINRGKCIGILGKNGAGKSTLLQIIARTLEPTSGTVNIQGKVAALLELGSGFNPDFTGRENVYLNAAILGLTDKEINHKFDEIACFADIGDFIEQPVKSYSSGMMMRLAFAVQTAVEPDILIVDEALAVGDARFQKKCFDRMYRLKKMGSTILLVTHDSGTIVQMCDRAIILENGRLFDEGDPHQISRSYHRLLFGTSDSSSLDIDESNNSYEKPINSFTTTTEPETSLLGKLDKTQLTDKEIRYGTREAEIINVSILDSTSGTNTLLLEIGKTYIYRIIVRYNTDIFSNVIFGFMISNNKGVEIYATKSSLFNTYLEPANCGHTFECSMTFPNFLVPGYYFLTVALAPIDVDDIGDIDKSGFYDIRFDSLQFQVFGSIRCHATSLIDLNAQIFCKQC